MSRKARSNQVFTLHTSRGCVLHNRNAAKIKIKSRSDAVPASNRIIGAAFTGKLWSDEQELWSRAKVRHLLSGQTLVLQNTAADAVFLVVSGRFEIRAEGQPDPIAEIGAGEPIGEIAFFAGGLRTATAIAVRDSVVLELDRGSFEEVARCTPALYSHLLASLAQRLAYTSARVKSGTRVAAARTITVIPAGGGGIPPEFFHRLRAVFGGLAKCLFLTHANLEEHFPNLKLDDPTIVNWLNAIESEYELVVYLADKEATDWTRKAIRQADQLVLLAYGSATCGLNPAEEIALAAHSASHRRLVRIHDHRVPFTSGTAEWLRERDVAMHHHVSLEDDGDLKSLYRFLTGRAVGFVAGGGGGFGPAHAGIFKAFQELGVKFDILGGASVGAAVMAGFAVLLTPAEIDIGIEDIFVTSRGFKRRTFFPRYSLLDHVAFDKALQRQYLDARIEDAWVPYFAVATDVDRAGQSLYLMRRGPLWKAVRASSSIPAVLPPMFTDDGRMLVDGGIVDNIPLTPMKALKSGPNLIVHFGMPPTQPYTIKYESIPGRWRLLRGMINPLAWKNLPDVPGPVSILRRCLCIHQNPDLLPVEPLDLVLAPPPFPGSSFLDFDRHSEVFEAGYKWCSAELDKLAAEHNPVLESILATRN